MRRAKPTIRSNQLGQATLKILLWLAIAVLGASALGAIALHRGETINSFWFVVAASCVYAIGYRFYSLFVATKVLCLDGSRATPAERLN
ncbi:MAG: carbon starvation CstA family protein, partial [Gammaproteobacteria bacterium]